MSANLENSVVATGLEKVSFHPSLKKGNAKECFNYHTVALISHASKVRLKIFQARLQQYVSQEFPDVQAGFRKGRGTRDQIANVHWIIKKASEFQKKKKKTASLTTLKPLTVDHNKLGDILRDGNIRPPYVSPQKPVCGSRSNIYYIGVM